VWREDFEDLGGRVWESPSRGGEVMLEFGNVTRTDYAAAVIASAYAASDLDEQEGEAQEIIDHWVDPPTKRYHTSASGATEAISRVQQALEDTEAVGSELGAMVEALDELSAGGLSEKRSAYLISDVEKHVATINDASQQVDPDGDLFVQVRGEELVISIGNGSSIRVELPAFSVDLQDVDLTNEEDVAAFAEGIQAGLTRITAEEMSLTEQLDRLKNATQIIEYPGSASIAIADENAATAMATLAATSVVQNLSVLFAAADGLSNETAAALLG
jgi:hypothetical protein